MNDVSSADKWKCSKCTQNFNLGLPGGHLKDFSLSSHNPGRVGHEYLASKGWSFKREKSARLRLSPGRKLQFYKQGEAEAFEEDRQACQGDEYKAAKLFYEKMRKKNPGVCFGKLLKGGLNSLFSDGNADPSLQDAMSKKNIGQDNDNECFECGDGGGEKEEAHITHMSLILTLCSAFYRPDFMRLLPKIISCQVPQTFLE